MVVSIIDGRDKGRLWKKLSCLHAATRQALSALRVQSQTQRWCSLLDLVNGTDTKLTPDNKDQRGSLEV